MSDLMSVEIKEVHTKKELKRFIKFPFGLYKDNPYYVTPLIDFEMETLLKDKNPAFEHADARYWVAEKEGKIVGRIAAIILDKELEQKSLARFGWLDFIDDKEVSNLLFETAKKWTESKGAKSIHGPMGFTDLDFEGALIEGFDKLTTQATIYNYPYYIDHFRAWNLVIATTWIENRLVLPDQVPERLVKGAKFISNRYNLRIMKFKKIKDVMEYTPKIFELLNVTYSHLYGYYPFTQKQIDYYKKQYFKFIRKEFVSVAVDKDDNVVGFSLSLPSLSKALNKARGRLFPFGFIHILKAFKSNKCVDIFLIGVLPRHQKHGVSAMLAEDSVRAYIKKGVKYINSGPMLESNSKVLISWKDFDVLSDKIRRSCFIKHF